MLEYQQLKEILPQAYPFLLIDRVEEFTKNESLLAVKNITSDEWIFGDPFSPALHFPETLLIEAAAQSSLVLYHLSRVTPGQKRPNYYLGRIKAEFFEEVLPGDRVELKVAAGKILDDGGYTDVTLCVASQKVAELQLIYKVIKN